MAKGLLYAGILGPLLGVTGSASAQDVAPPPPDAAMAGAGPARQGIALHLGLGYGDCTGKACDDDPGSLEGGLGIGLDAGYRFMPMLSAGLQFHYQMMSAKDADDLSVSAMNYGLLLRVFPLDSGEIDPYAGLGFGLISQTTSGDLGLGDMDFSANGTYVGINLGADYRIGESLSAGLDFQYTIAMFSEVCADDDCADLDDDAKKDAPNFWQVGLALGYTLPM